MAEQIKITISARFPVQKNGGLKRPKQVMILVYPSNPPFLENEENHAWLEDVIERFRCGPGKEKKRCSSSS